MEIEQLKMKWEIKFGKNNTERTRKQWKAIVKMYGMKNVMSEENMTTKEIKAKCKN